MDSEMQREQTVAWGTIHVLTSRLSSLVEKIEEKWDLVMEARKWVEVVRDREIDLEHKAQEIEELRQELKNGRHFYEKELESLQRSWEEKFALLQKDASERLEMERKHFEERLSLERELWTERLAHEQDHHAHKISQAQQDCSLWSRLVKLLTWEG